MSLPTKGKLSISLTHPATGRETRILDLGELGPRHDALTRRVIGIPLTDITGSGLGTDGLLGLWWLAGNIAGKKETFRVVMETWSTFAALEAADPDVELDDEEPSEADDDMGEPLPAP